MKTTRILLSAFLAGGLIMNTGCSKDDSTPSHTPTENKQIIEDEGLKMMQSMEGLSNLEAVTVAQDLAKLFESSSVGLSAPAKFVQAVANLKSNPQSASSVLKVAATTPLQTEFNANAGIYTWSEAKGDFVKTSATGKIAYVFTSGSKSCSLTFDNLSTSTATQLNDVSGYELLKSFRITLASGSTALLTFEFTGEYNSEDLPSKLVESLTFAEGFVIANTLTNSTSKVSIEQSLKKGSTNIITYYAEAQGDLSYNNIGENMGDDVEKADQDVVNSVTTSITLGNLKAQGTINVANVDNTMDDDDSGYANKAEADADVALLNDNVELSFMNDETGEVIATSEFYTEVNTDYGTYYDVEMRMKFAYDGSYVSEAYFNAGFEDFLKETSDFINAVNTHYGTDFDSEVAN